MHLKMVSQMPGMSGIHLIALLQKLEAHLVNDMALMHLNLHVLLILTLTASCDFLNHYVKVTHF